MPKSIVYKMGIMGLAAGESWNPKIETYIDWLLENNPGDLDGLLAGMEQMPQTPKIKKYIQEKFG